MSADRQGKERLYEASEAGREANIRYREVRDACLIETLTALGTVDTQEIGDAARVLRALSGLYDQAARAATSLWKADSNPTQYKFELLQNLNLIG